MRQEITRLTFLFATFVIAYVLRFFYQMGLSDKTYVRMIPSMYHRWLIVIFLPFIWDIISIISIFILHYKSFKQPNEKLPKAGHYNENSDVPTIDTVTLPDNSGNIDSETLDSRLNTRCSDQHQHQILIL